MTTHHTSKPEKSLENRKLFFFNQKIALTKCLAKPLQKVQLNYSTKKAVTTTINC